MSEIKSIELGTLHVTRESEDDFWTNHTATDPQSRTLITHEVIYLLKDGKERLLNLKEAIDKRTEEIDKIIQKLMEEIT